MSTINSDQVLQMKSQKRQTARETEEQQSNAEEKLLEVLEKKLSRSIDVKFEVLKKKTVPVRIFPRVIIYAMIIIAFVLLFRHHKNTVQKMTQRYQLQMQKLEQQVKQMIKTQNNNFMTTIQIYQNMVLAKKETITFGGNDTNSINLVSEQNINELISLENKNLKYLYLWNQKLGDKNVISIISAPWFKQLKALEINGNNLTDKVIDALVKAKQENLVWLNFQNNSVSQEGILKLLNSSHMLPNLKYLNYKNNDIKDIYKIHYTVNQMLPNVRVATEENNDL